MYQSFAVAPSGECAWRQTRLSRMSRARSDGDGRDGVGSGDAGTAGAGGAASFEISIGASYTLCAAPGSPTSADGLGAGDDDAEGSRLAGGHQAGEVDPRRGGSHAPLPLVRARRAHALDQP